MCDCSSCTRTRPDESRSATSHSPNCLLVDTGFGICTCAGRRRVYIAARSGMKEDAAALARLLRLEGAVVCSTWHDDARFEPDVEKLTDEECDRESVRDELEIQRSNVLVRLSDGTPGTRGANLVELGLARGYGLRIVLVGPAVNVFDRRRDVVRAQAGDDVVAKVLA